MKKCICCGRTDNFPLSMGGPNICPKCDCGHCEHPRKDLMNMTPAEYKKKVLDPMLENFLSSKG